VVLADGEAAVLKAVRDQLYLGATQIKILAGGGFSSKWDHILTTQYTLKEMKAAVDAASDYGTYVMAHLYTKESMLRAAEAGVRSFEHAHMFDDELARIVKDKDIWLCLCPQQSKNWIPRPDLPAGSQPEDMDDFIAAPGSMAEKYGIALTPERRKFVEGEIRQTELIIKYNLNFAFGTDAMRREVPGETEPQLEDLAIYKKRFGSFKGLRAATGDAGRLLALSTYQNPYQEGKLGVLEEGSYADLLLVDGNPVEDLDILTQTKNTRVIIKGGVLYKNTL
jgi:imidazolonepropionase-like amidohydrolase